jgi:phosphoadenosine phosphosulfate reductase
MSEVREGSLILSLDRWQKDHGALSPTEMNLGLALEPNESPLDIEGDVHRFSQITVNFLAFIDGRGYSIARLLRERMGYRGELRAVGDIQRDQFNFLRRCGFNTVEGLSDSLAKLWDKALFEISVPFQAASDGRLPVPELRSQAETATLDHTLRLEQLIHRYQGQSAQDILKAAIRKEFSGQIALVSSFGAEAAVLLHMVSEIDPTTPVLFLNTGKIFGETLRYRTLLTEQLGLLDVRDLKPKAELLTDRDPGGVLWASDPDACCFLRKVEPLNRALAGFNAWITGRKRSHGAERTELVVAEALDGRFKINPLAGWNSDDVVKYFVEHDLPRHPLEADGYRSIGCMTCTDRIADGENVRDGRWRDSEKTECGIHLPISSFKDYGVDI